MKNKLHNSKIISEIIYSEVFPIDLSGKSRARSLSILDSAIYCYTTLGIENTTYEAIAEKAGISRPLIFRYFTDQDEIFYKAIKLIRVHFQHFAVNAIGQHKTPADQLKAYITSVFDWTQQFPDYAKGLFLYLQRCSCFERDRDLNTQFTIAGRNRISALLRLGVASGEFSCTDLDTTAHLVQTMITGALTSVMSETTPAEIYKQITLNFCLNLVGVKGARE